MGKSTKTGKNRLCLSNIAAPRTTRQIAGQGRAFRLVGNYVNWLRKRARDSYEP
jgi:hypothetical protein